MFSYYEVFAPKKAGEVRAWCTQARKGCTECKAILAEILNEELKPIRDKRRELEQDKKRIRDILEEGRKKARAIAQQTMSEIREVIF